MKTRMLPTGASCIVPMPSEDDRHEFGMFSPDGELLHTGLFPNIEKALSMAKETFGDGNYNIKDLTEEFYVERAAVISKKIKEINSKLKMSRICIDMSRFYHSFSGCYTYVPFLYNNTEWEYREDASSDWICKK